MHCDQYIGYNYDLKDAGYGYGKIEDSLEIRKKFKHVHKDFKNCIFIDLTRINIFFFKKLINFSFVDLSTQDYNPNSNELSIHFRNVIKSGKDTRINFSEESADLLVKQLSIKGYKINIIGHPRFSYCPTENCIDCRSENIGVAIENIQNSLITIGQLSGPIHLAHLCNRPVITWADSEERFETVKMWNPHNQACLVVSVNTFNPDVFLIIKKIDEFKDK
jgi:ADP-heptose:LPS heptosyltransferase